MAPLMEDPAYSYEYRPPADEDFDSSSIEWGDSCSTIFLNKSEDGDISSTPEVC